MAKIVAGLAVLVSVGIAAAVVPAKAEFFGCNDKPGKVLYSYTGSSGRVATSTRYTHEFAAQSRPRITIFPPAAPGPHAKRHCRSWLAREYRVSGPVVVPHRECWWQ